MNNNFSLTSRYYGIETTTLETTEGKVVIYLRRRFVPSPERFALLREHVIKQGERLDNITALYLGDPEQFWRVCDANGAMRPEELTETIGRRLRITLPEGIPEFQMLKGINLTLMIGPAVPIPAPKVVVDSLTSVQVNSGGERGGFQLTFAVSKKSTLLTTMLPAGYFDPIITRVIIVVTLNGTPNVLMDGIITRQELAPSSEPGQSTLTITGEDLSVLMDIVEMPFMRFPATPVIGRVYQILAKYAAFGVVPLGIPPFINVVPIPTNKIPAQQGTDLAYLKKMAGDHGYVFYVEPGPLPGQNIAYWGPDIRIPIPQPALSINMDAHTNVESISFSLEGMAKKILVFGVFDPATKKIPIPVPLPNINIFKPPLGLRLTPPAKVEFPDWAVKEELPDILNRALGALARSAHAISASGSLDVLRYGRVLRARMLVGVRGAGLAYDGLYYVNTVTHNIKRGEYKQSFQLSRDGLISNTPRLPV